MASLLPEGSANKPYGTQPWQGPRLPPTRASERPLHEPPLFLTACRADNTVGGGPTPRASLFDTSAAKNPNAT